MVSRQYKTSWYIGYSVIALSFIFIAQERSIAQCVRIPSFYSDIVFAFVTTFATAVYLKKLDSRLNETYPIATGLKSRIKQQILWGILVPTLVAMLLEILYLYSISISPAESSILNLELPLTLLFLTIVNLSYFALNLYEIAQAKKTEEPGLPEAVPKTQIDHVMVQYGALEERIPIADCAYLYSSQKILWLQTFSGEQYRLKGTLEQWEEQLSEVNFYRINRQFLAAPRAIISVEQTETRKLKVNLVVVPAEEVFVSKPNAARFRQWWEQKRPL